MDIFLDQLIISEIAMRKDHRHRFMIIVINEIISQ